MMTRKFDTEGVAPEDLTLSETLRLLAEELTNCTDTLRETHNLIAPQLEELERRYPNAVTLSDDQRSLGRAQGRDSA
jgi:hypothetical protein